MQLLTIIALTYGGLVDGAVLIETVFAWPGFGQYLVNALISRDMNAVLGCTLADRAHLHRAQPFVRRALSHLRPEDPMSGNTATAREVALPASAPPAALRELGGLARRASASKPLPLLRPRDRDPARPGGGPGAAHRHPQPLAQTLGQTLQPPSAAHWLGTDQLGRDIYSRLVYGARYTLLIVFLVSITVAPIGLLVGCRRRLSRRLDGHSH